MVRRPWKYVMHENSETELYNLVNDPFELINLAGQGQNPVIPELQQGLLDWCDRTQDPFLEKI